MNWYEVGLSDVGRALCVPGPVRSAYESAEAFFNTFGVEKDDFPSLPAIDGSRSGSRDRVWLVSELIQSLIRVRYPFGNAPSPVMKHCLTGP